jgi:selenocysteine-specific elongation factor
MTKIARRFIVGTAGHIDHGKTALVHALTGIDADRLPEEKARGITIDLGFAHLSRGDARIGFVDVPGHERFVRNMLAGAGGIDAVLLVVAADEGVKPQTREHFAITRLLGIPRGIVALTKSDRVPEDLASVAELEVREFLAGSFLESAPIVHVSAKTGAGIDRLADALFAMMGGGAGEREKRALRLPVDRAFSIAGFGPVVTGSLIDGSIAPEQKVEILPEGTPARVRRVEVHDEEVSSARAGERTSVNLAGVDQAALRRGQMIVAPGSIRATDRVLVKLTLLPDAPGLETGAEVSFHHFASERIARLRLWDDVLPGSTVPALATLDEPIAARTADRFIVRRLSPAATIGGGEILDAHPPRKIDDEDRRVFLEGNIADRLVRRVARNVGGARREDLAREESIREQDVRPALSAAISTGAVRELDGGKLYLSSVRWDILAFRSAAAITDEIKHRPGAVGASRAAVLEKAFAAFPPREGEIVLRSIIDAGKLVAEGETLRLPGGGALAGGDQKLAGRIAAMFEEGGLEPPSPGDVAVKLEAKPKIVEGLIAYLVKEKRLARMPGGFIIARSAADRVIESLRTSGRTSISVPEFKEMFGLTRRIAIPLLEYLDETKVTRRAGDTRTILPR